MINFNFFFNKIKIDKNLSQNDYSYCFTRNNIKL